MACELKKVIDEITKIAKKSTSDTIKNIVTDGSRSFKGLQGMLTEMSKYKESRLATIQNKVLRKIDKTYKDDSEKESETYEGSEGDTIMRVAIKEPTEILKTISKSQLFLALTRVAYETDEKMKTESMKVFLTNPQQAVDAIAEFIEEAEETLKELTGLSDTSDRDKIHKAIENVNIIRQELLEQNKAEINDTLDKMTDTMEDKPAKMEMKEECKR